MGRVVGALFGLAALAAFGFGAAEMFRATGGEDLLAPLGSYVPPEIWVWRDRIPFAGAEDAPPWRDTILWIALGVGALGGLLLLLGARLSAMLLWLAFLLLGGVLIGQDLILGGGIETIDQPTLIAGGAAIGATLLLALIGQLATGVRRSEDLDLAGVAVRYAEPGRDAPPREHPAARLHRERGEEAVAEADDQADEDVSQTKIEREPDVDPLIDAEPETEEATDLEGDAEQDVEPDPDLEVVEAELVKEPDDEDVR